MPNPPPSRWANGAPGAATYGCTYRRVRSAIVAPSGQRPTTTRSPIDHASSLRTGPLPVSVSREAVDYKMVVVTDHAAKEVVCFVYHSEENKFLNGTEQDLRRQLAESEARFRQLNADYQRLRAQKNASRETALDYELASRTLEALDSMVYSELGPAQWTLLQRNDLLSFTAVRREIRDREPNHSANSNRLPNPRDEAVNEVWSYFSAYHPLYTFLEDRKKQTGFARNAAAHIAPSRTEFRAFAGTIPLITDVVRDGLIEQSRLVNNIRIPLFTP